VVAFADTDGAGTLAGLRSANADVMPATETKNKRIMTVRVCM
jgi:hypothetical protein